MIYPETSWKRTNDHVSVLFGFSTSSNKSGSAALPKHPKEDGACADEADHGWNNLLPMADARRLLGRQSGTRILNLS